MNGSAASYLVGAVTNPTGVTADLSHDFDTSTMPAPDYQAFLQGQFKVAISGTAVASFTVGNPNADMVSTFHFVAYK